MALQEVLMVEQIMPGPSTLISMYYKEGSTTIGSNCQKVIIL